MIGFQRLAINLLQTMALQRHAQVIDFQATCFTLKKIFNSILSSDRAREEQSTLSRINEKARKPSKVI